jgi:nitrile hydratase beta subunit
MGGMTCFGPVPIEDNEPVFHADWERQAFATMFAASTWFWPADRFRHARERLDPVDYLATSYYEQWVATVELLLKELGYATDAEIESGVASFEKELPHAAPDAAAFEGLVRSGAPATRDDGRLDPAYAIGDKVRARNMEIEGHTRLARYVRGKIGRITSFHGSHVFPDTAAHDLGENAQPLYTVRFEAKELWGDNVARRDAVYIDLWEDYLERPSP